MTGVQTCALPISRVSFERDHKSLSKGTLGLSQKRPRVSLKRDQESLSKETKSLSQKRPRVSFERDSRFLVMKRDQESLHIFVLVTFFLVAMGWLRLVGPLKSQVSFAEYRLFYGALLQKRPVILRSLLIAANPYHEKRPRVFNRVSKDFFPFWWFEFSVTLFLCD